ncbi:MAG: cysteine synthase A [Desulfuromonas sp.]|nr:MAG: cysteine synthase A [Desulfuromonas sp.]
MAKVFSDNSLSIGRTPLVQLNEIVPDGSKVFAKVEGRNPAYSVKCRIGASMIWDAMQSGRLKPGMEIVEPTSGNTGIALAFVAAAKKIPITLIMPETMSLERRRVLKAFGARLILTPGTKGMAGAVAEAERIAEEAPERYLLLHQFKNPANPEIHVMTTGPEIWEDLEGKVDVLVAGVGTGGTISGISRYFKKVRKQPLISVAVEPADSPVISQHLEGAMLRPGPHKIQGIGAGFIPETLDLEMIDRVETVTNEDAYEYARRLAKEEGLLSGISCGAAAAVAARLAAQPEFRGKNIVVILPDSGERYLSSDLFND